MGKDIDFMCSNVKSICRTCYQTSIHLHPLDEKTEQFPLKSLADLLLDIAKIDTKESTCEDAMPRQLCSNCSRKLKNAYTFVLRAQEINEKLLQLAKISATGSGLALGLDCLLEAPIDIPSNAAEFLQIKMESEYADESLFDSFSLPDHLNDDFDGVADSDKDEVKKAGYDFDDEDEDSLANIKRKSSASNVQLKAEESQNNEIKAQSLNNLSKKEKSTIDPITVTRTKRKLRSAKNEDYDSDSSKSESEWEEKPKRRRGRPRLAKNMPNSKGRHSCEKCGKTFAWKKDLQRHAVYHDPNPAFQCDLCGRKFMRKDKLKEHLRKHERHLSENGEFDRRRSRHPEWNFAERLYSQQRFKIIACKLCDGKFESTQLLRLHLLTHTDISSLESLTVDDEVIKELYPQTLLNLEQIKTQICQDVAEKRFGKFYAVVNEHGYELCLSDSDVDVEDTPSALSKYSCAICHEAFARKFQAFVHLKEKHASEKMPYKCTVCKVEFVCREMFDVHTRTQCRNKEKKYRCLKCPGKFMWVDNLDNHNCSNRFNSPEYKAQLPKKRELLQCNVCDKTFVWRKDLKRHKETHEPDSIFHECPICYQRFRKAKNLRQHSKQAHEQLRRRIECCLCGEKFIKLSQLRAHLPQHADGCMSINSNTGLFFKIFSSECLGAPEQLAAEIANDFAMQNTSRFYSAVDESGNELNLYDSETDAEEEEEHKGTSNVPAAVYKCGICLQEFDRRKRILVHQNAEHADLEALPNRCEHCSKQFVCLELLQLHIGRDCRNVYKKWQCSKCSSRFVWEENLQAHLKIKHTDPEQQISRKHANKLQCDDCDKTFIWPKDLNRHKRCHLPDDEKFECPFCTRRFNRKDNMQAHLKVHGAEAGPATASKRELSKASKHTKVKSLNENLCKPNGCKLIQCKICLSKHTKIADLRTHLRTHQYVVSFAQREEDITEISLQLYPDEAPMALENILIERIIADITEQRLERFYSITSEVGYELAISDSETESDSDVEEETVRNTYACDLCSKAFQRKYKLFEHQKYSHDWLDAPHVCEVCDARFLSDDFLQFHLNTQCKNIKKRFTCKKCPLKFMWKDNLKTHERTLHPEKEEMKRKFDASRYKCEECHRSFAWQKDLTRHMVTHQPEVTVFKCMWCPRHFYRKDNLYVHIHRHGVTPECLAAAESHIAASSGPNGKKEIQCKVCNIQFMSISALRNHIVQSSFEMGLSNADASLKAENQLQPHHNYDSLMNYSITNQLGFEMQIDDSESDEESMGAMPKSEGIPIKYSCDLCQMDFLRKFEIGQHQRTVHQYEQMPQKCDKCTFKTVSKDILAHHMRTQCYNLEKSFQCSTCSFKFMWQENLQSHIQNMHPQDMTAETEDTPKSGETNHKPFQCEMCKCKYNRKDRLVAHIKKVHTEGYIGKVIDASEIDPVTGEKNKKPPLEKKYLCAFCGRAVTSSSNLIIHMRRHTGEKPFKCDFCDMAFPRSSDLQCHRRTHTGEKPHKCTVCDKAFSRSYKLQTHMRIHSGERPYKCTYCEKSFTQSNDLTLHIRRHTGERPYVCGICGERFIQGTALKNHRTMRGHYEDVEPRKLTILERF